MKTRSLLTKDDLVKASNDLLNLEGNLPMVLTLTAGKKIRSDKQNQRYWCDIKYFLDEINSTISSVAEHTGYSPLEVKRLLAASLEPEQVGILYARKSDVIHDVLKQICNIPTSTRLGTKDFMRYEGILEQTISEIIGSIRSVAIGVRVNGRKPNKIEKIWLDKIVEHGCCVCWNEFGFPSPATVHHINGSKKEGCHLDTIPLCFSHHLSRENNEKVVSRHPWKAEFEKRYGRELDFLDKLRETLHFA